MCASIPSAGETRGVPASAPVVQRVEEWLSGRSRLVLGTLVTAAVIFRLLYCLQMAPCPLVHADRIIPDSDNYFFRLWAMHIAAGDWLQREPMYPLNTWMRQASAQALAHDPVLPVRLGLTPDLAYDREEMGSKLWKRWLGGAVYFQEPLYPYLVALTYWLAGENVWYVFVWQLVLGTANVVMIYELARRLHGETAGALAGMLAIAYPVIMFHELTLQRDVLVVTFTLGLAVAMGWVCRLDGKWRWCVFGFMVGISILLKQTFVLYLPLLGLLRIATRRTEIRRRAIAVAAVAAGALIALSPALVRNAMVGVPIFALNASGSTMLPVFHVAGAPPCGFVAQRSVGVILARTDGHILRALAEAVRTHSSIWKFLWLNVRKLAYVWKAYEMPNNVDFYLFRQQAPILRTLALPFWVIPPLALIGLVAERRRLREPGLLLMAALGSIPTMLLATVLSRYRLPLTASLLPFAAVGLICLARMITERRLIPLSITVLAAGPYLVWATGSPPGWEPGRMALAHVELGDRMLSRGAESLAALHYAEAVRLSPTNGPAQLRLGELLTNRGDASAGLPHLEKALQQLQRSAKAHVAISRALIALGRRGEAMAHLQEAVTLQNAPSGTKDLLERLEAGTSPGPRPTLEQ